MVKNKFIFFIFFGKQETFQEKCEKIQLKYSSVVDKAKSYGNAFIQRLDKQDAEHEKDLDIQV